MKKILLFIPAMLAITSYIVLGCLSGFGAISPFVWMCLLLMLVSAVVMLKDMWYGCIGGIIVGVVLIYMSTQYTGQVIDIERPLGSVLIIYHLVCGLFLYNRILKK